MASKVKYWAVSDRPGGTIVVAEGSTVAGLLKAVGGKLISNGLVTERIVRVTEVELPAPRAARKAKGKR